MSPSPNCSVSLALQEGQGQSKSFRLDLVGARQAWEVVFVQPWPDLKQKFMGEIEVSFWNLCHMSAQPGLLPFPRRQRGRALTEARKLGSPPCLILGQPSGSALHCNHLCYQWTQRLARHSRSRKRECKSSRKYVSISQSCWGRAEGEGCSRKEGPLRNCNKISFEQS